MNATERRERMDGLAHQPDPLRRKLIALGLLTDRLSSNGLIPVLVGGTAVEYYTAGGYASKDIDLALPTADSVNEAFEELGFRKEGRFWVREELDLLFEAPTGDLEGEEAPRTEIEIDGLRVIILGLEDLLLDRLRAWVHWKSEEDGRWTRRLAALHGERLDWNYLMKKAVDPAEQAAVATIREECGNP